MHESLEIIVEIIAIVTFCATVVNYIIIKPLRDSITSLTTAVIKLEDLLHKLEESEIKLDKRVSINEHKIGTLTEKVELLEEFHRKP